MNQEDVHFASVPMAVVARQWEAAAVVSRNNGVVTVENLVPKLVRAPDHEDVGEVIQWGKNVGSSPAIYCAFIHFPETGECRFYDIRRVTRIR